MYHLYRYVLMRLTASWHVKKKLHTVTMSPLSDYEIMMSSD